MKPINKLTIKKRTPDDYKNYNSDKIEALYPVVTWGKYADTDKRLNELPVDYLQWLAMNFSCPYIRSAALAALRDDPAPDPFNFVYLSLIKMDKGDKIGISAPYCLKNHIKDIPDRKWEPDHKLWSLPLYSYQDVVDTFPEAIISDKLTHRLDQDHTYQSEITDLQFATDYPVDTYYSLYPYQRVALQFLIKNNGNALLSLDQGTGKTIIALEYCLKGNLPSLVVCPKIVKSVWTDEIDDKYDLTYTVLNGIKPHPVEPVDITIMNYELLDGWKDHLNGFKFIIFDESHYLKSKDSKRTRAATQIAKTCKSLLMTGTPIMTHVKDLYPQLKIIAPETFGDYYGFTARYCNGHTNDKFGFWDATGSSNLNELNARLNSSCMFRRVKKDIMPDLPDKTISTIHIDNPNIDRYNMIDQSDITGLTEAIMWVSRHKIKGSIAFITDLFKTVDSVIYFSTHRDNLHAVASHFKVPYIDGGVPQKSREPLINAFKNGSLNLLCMNIKSGGMGINLQDNCSTVVIGETSWSPSVNDQAIDRVHRINQTNPVNVYYIIMKDSIDEYIEKQVIYKGKIIKSVVELHNLIKDSFT